MRCKNCGFVSVKKIRTGQYNKFFFATLIDPLSEHTGYNAKELYIALKVKLLVSDKLIPDGTSDMTNKELTKFIEDIVIFAADFYEFEYDPNGINDLISHYAEAR